MSFVIAIEKVLNAYGKREKLNKFLDAWGIDHVFNAQRCSNKPGQFESRNFLTEKDALEWTKGHRYSALFIYELFGGDRCIVSSYDIAQGLSDVKASY
jgi:hypothetical protein